MNSGLTIFYIDDDRDDLEFFKEIVDMIDDTVEVVTLRNGNDLMYALNNPPPTPYCIFLDINMPVMNGFEALKQVRALAAHKELPVVMFSTSGDNSTIERARELGASLYVQKSGMFDQLKRSIEHALSINWSTFRATEQNFLYTA
jgi:PleD family two-component response regulator